MFLVDSFGPGMKIGMNPRDDIFPKRPQLYISSLKLVDLHGSEVKTSINRRGGISTQVPKLVIFSRSCSSSLFDSLGLGIKIRMIPHDDIFPKTHKLFILRHKLAGLTRSGLKTSY